MHFRQINVKCKFVQLRFLLWMIQAWLSFDSFIYISSLDVKFTNSNSNYNENTALAL